MDTTRTIGTDTVVPPRDSRTMISLTGARTPPAWATTSRMRSPLGVSGTRAPLATSPPTVTVLLIGLLTLTRTCGWMALPSSARSISAWTDSVVRPITLTCPA